MKLWSDYASPTQNSLAMLYRATGMSTHFRIAREGFGAGRQGRQRGCQSGGGLPAIGQALGSGGGAISAGLGSASPVGGLSVPASWASTAGPAAASGASPIPLSRFITTPETSGPGNLLGGMPLAAGAGSSGAGPRYGIHKR